MKKLLLVLISSIFSACLFAQATSIFEAPQNNITTTQLRAPNGLSTSAYMRACALVLQSELAYIPNNTTLTSFGFTLTTSSNVTTPVSGNFTLYLQNTTDVANNKGTTWATIPTGMTTCYASILTIPIAATSTSVIVTLSTPFVYTGGGLYVAYDWYSAGPYSTAPATFWSENAALTTGCSSSVSATGAPATLAASNFRPSFLFGFANPYANDVAVYAIEAPGRIAGTLGQPHTVGAWVKNISNVPLTNITLTASAAGANIYSNTQTVSSLAAGASTFVNFGPFNPTLPGSQTVSVVSANDNYNSNNTKGYLQQVTCDIAGQGPAVSGYSFNAVGFNTGAGIISTPYNNVTTNTLVGIRGAVSTNTASIGNTIYGVLMSGAGAILATSNNVVLTNAMLGTFVTFTFPSPPVLSPATTYYLGFAQTANTALGYFPAGSYGTNYLQPNLFYTNAITGGALTVLPNNFGFFGIEAVLAHSVTVSASTPTVNCGSSATITALSTTNYSWSTGATTSSIVITTPTITSNYTVIATNTLGCSASRVATVVVNPLVVSASTSPTLICANNPVSLTASGASNFTWTTASGSLTSAILTDTPVANVSYTLVGANFNGCTTTTIIPLTVNPLPFVNVNIGSPSICLGSTVGLYSNGNATTYSWSTGANGSTTTASPSANTVFVLTAFSSVGCSQTASTSVIVDSFTPGITSSTAICSGNSIQLIATGATTVQWSTGSVFSSITVTPATTTTYSVTGKGGNVCVGTNTTLITVQPTPTVLAAITKTAICRGESAVMSASGAVTYSWSTSATGPTVSLSPTLTTLQTYTVTGINAAGCPGSAEISLRVSTCAGINEQNTATLLRVFPNPTSGLLYLIADEYAEGCALRCFDLTGRLLFESKLHSDQQSIDFSGFKTGLYVLNVTLENGEQQNIKVLVE